MSLYVDGGFDERVSLRLFCFHSAGAGESLFRGWKQELGAHIDVIPVLLPGRERRMREPRFQDLSTLLRDLEPHLDPLLMRPHALFGHSMGALVALGLARMRLAAGKSAPRALFASACAAPGRSSCKSAELFDDDTLLGLLKSIGGQPPEMLTRDDWRRLLLPIVRDDLLVCANYEWATTAPLTCPIYPLAGADDDYVGLEQMEAWRHLTLAPRPVRSFAGGHFYLRSARADVLAHVRDVLEPPSGSPAGVLREPLPLEE